MTTNKDRLREQWRESKKRQRKGEAAAKPGPVPNTEDPAIRTTVSLPTSTTNRIKALDPGGSLSKGIRILAKKYSKRVDKS